MAADSQRTKEKTHNGSNRVGFVTGNLEGFAMKEMYQSQVVGAIERLA